MKYFLQASQECQKEVQVLHVSASSWTSLPLSLGPAQLHTGTQRQSRFSRKTQLACTSMERLLPEPFHTPPTAADTTLVMLTQQMRKPLCRKQALYVKENNDPVAKGALELDQNGAALSIHFPCDSDSTVSTVQLSTSKALSKDAGLSRPVAPLDGRNI